MKHRNCHVLYIPLHVQIDNNYGGAQLHGLGTRNLLPFEFLNTTEMFRGKVDKLPT